METFLAKTFQIPLCSSLCASVEGILKMIMHHAVCLILRVCCSPLYPVALPERDLNVGSLLCCHRTKISTQISKDNTADNNAVSFCCLSIPQTACCYSYNLPLYDHVQLD